MPAHVTQDRFLGALLGMAIGDAMGMPVAGWTATQIRGRLGRVTTYHRRVFPDGVEIKPGEFTDVSEIALCIVESITTNLGAVDPDNIGARMVFLARGESKRWMGAETRAALERAAERMSYVVVLDEDGPATGDVAARGIPIGLLHAGGDLDAELLRNDAETVTRITHGSPVAIAATTAVAYGMVLAAGGESPPADWLTATAAFVGVGTIAAELDLMGQRLAAGVSADEVIAEAGTGDDASAVVAGAFAAAALASRFEDAVESAANAGGAADARAAIAGALAGARLGATGIPQRLIDDLEGRIYVSLAAPWFHQRAMMQTEGAIRHDSRD
ncbi:MAG: ADP-ribosylglycohydrolase family protein [Thermomicrobiales bacterium]